MGNKYLTPLQTIALKIFWDNNTEWKLFQDISNNQKLGWHTIQTLFIPQLGTNIIIFETFKFVTTVFGFWVPYLKFW